MKTMKRIIFIIKTNNNERLKKLYILRIKSLFYSTIF